MADLTDTLRTEAPARRFEGVDSAAERVGVSSAYLWKLLRLRELNRYRVGRRTLIDAAELDALITRGLDAEETADA